MNIHTVVLDIETSHLFTGPKFFFSEIKLDVNCELVLVNVLRVAHTRFYAAVQLRVSDSDECHTL